MTGEVFIGGHSLGAARAYEYAYARVVRGLRVDGIFALAPPNPGCAAIGKALAADCARVMASGPPIERQMQPALPPAFGDGKPLPSRSESPPRA
jgi:predicted alpha/beta hydrolase family esterase